MNNVKLEQILEEYRKEYVFSILVGGSLAAAPNGSDTFLGQISNDAAFQCESLTMIYTTLIAGPADGGACQILARIEDTGRSIYLQSALTPVNLFASPGRVRSSAIAGDPSHTLFYPFPFEHVFRPSSEISIECRNNADYANDIYFLFLGKKLRVNFDNPTINV